jgi:hypothetical protein
LCYVSELLKEKHNVPAVCTGESSRRKERNKQCSVLNYDILTVDLTVELIHEVVFGTVR